ncbi:nicotinate-nucleotide-dimethylbenzimidazole phosphoribosyltransferase [Desulfosporosinus acidiphilus SJ4]|uniref:Nicotinate-nucleotide--dimethylbenzimidazole phosphoribosyltransferase n=1 Tax=Desulfosporosinus acidiphilus (strain DSM 22704 / JCM 16185 / SJ4) TaxID=646529 RepID=I4D929_DESAJ|nr:nicotinate-nucleotide--dimethylbenzimidazole phosphoribosyltransferase [Desulfosporosinus acidiphilus]AFM42303.1 nicotinate-nucleotide-dimethylbenzimidazole phosphoribosyltransferase [Desulfosporosinus acidiphilus SJ4]
MTTLKKIHGLDNLKKADIQQLEAALQELTNGIEKLDQESISGMQKRLDAKIKPLRSLGVLEDISQQLAGIQRTSQPEIKGKAVLLMAGDHGVVAEGVSAAPQEITAQMFYSYLNGEAGINVLARNSGAKVICTDIGIALPLDPPELMANRVKNGTGNIAHGPAMTKQEALLALLTGAKVAAEAIDSGINLLATGEVGIGNTTPSAALISAFTGHTVEEVTGRGTGLKDDALKHKQDVIKLAIRVNEPDLADPLDTLAKIGGLEIAALAGAILEAAYQHVPIILDGIISTAAALTAAQIAPLSALYMISSHNSEEQGHRIALKQLGLKPRLDFNMRLGEGTGAALMFPMVEAALKIADEMATFESAGVSTGDF